MDLQFERLNDTLIVKIKGELDLHTADELRREIDEEFKTDERLTNLIMDMEGIEFIDSSGVGVILGRYKMIKERGGKLAMVSITPQVKRIFELSGMLQLMSIFDNIDQAKKAFGPGGF